MNEEKDLVSLQIECDFLERNFEKVKTIEKSLYMLDDLCDAKCDLLIKIGDRSGLGREYEIKMNGKYIYSELKSIIDKKRNAILEEKEEVLKNLKKSVEKLNEKRQELKEKNE